MAAGSSKRKEWCDASHAGAIRDRFRNKFSVPNAQRFLHAIAQSIASEGFGQEVIGARSEGVSARNFPVHSRDKDDRDSRRGRVASKDFTDRKAIDVRQTHIEQDEVGRLMLDKRESVRPRFGGENFEAGFLKVILDEFDKVRFVVNHQDFGRHVRALAQRECAEQRQDRESAVTKGQQ